MGGNQHKTFLTEEFTYNTYDTGNLQSCAKLSDYMIIR